MRLSVLAALCSAVVLATACQSGPAPRPARTPPPDDASSPTETSSPAATPTTPAVDLAEVGANELGQIPVIMHHRIIEGGGEYDRSPEEFRAELQRLFDADFRPVRAVDLVRGELDVPAGTTPVVLTFDDSTREQFALDADGQVDADTAIGVLLDFAEEHPGFTPVASLYVNAGPFGVADSAPLLTWLHEHGFELGNHTVRHANLGQLSAEDVRKELALGARVVTDPVPDAEVATLSLPLGIWPEPRDLAYRGDHEGDEYVHDGVLLVGAHPSPSPFHTGFDPLAIPRIRSSAWDGGEPNYGSDYWLQWFEDNPDRRYVSDGDPEQVSFPEALTEELDEAHDDRGNSY